MLAFNPSENLFYTFTFLVAIVLSGCSWDGQSSFSSEGSTRSFTLSPHSRVTATPLGMKNKLDSDAPAIFRFLTESDYVVIGHRNGGTPVRKRGASVSASNRIAFEDWPGTVDRFRVKDVVFSGMSFRNGEPLSSNSLDEAHIYREISDWRATLPENEDYLLFLERVSDDDSLFSLLVLDSKKTYFRVYSGAESIFSGPSDSFHGKRREGRIDIRNANNAALVDRIRRLSSALIATGHRDRIDRLRQLLDSEDSVLRENAHYAIEYLSKLPS